MKISKSSAYSLHALMYMVRHITQLPATTNTIAKAEGIPTTYLAKIFQRLVKGKFVKSVKGRDKGYIFIKPPNKINLLELFECVEEAPLFNDCFLKHCVCNGTPENCQIYACWLNATKKIKESLGSTTIEAAAWNHPVHRFYSLQESLSLDKSNLKKVRVEKRKYGRPASSSSRHKKLK